MTRADETEQLCLDYRRTRDPLLHDRLVLAYTPLVRYLAGRLASGLPARVDEADLVSSGLRGPAKAIEQYDPARDVRFERYAMSRIKDKVIDEMRSADWRPAPPDEPEAEGGLGVREPRRPKPSGSPDAAALHEPQSDEAA